MYEYKLLAINLALFDGATESTTVRNMNLNATTSDGMSVEMKTFYSDHLIELMEAELVHDRFAQKHPIPQNGGKKIEFRKYDPLPEMTTPLVEGVTPAGQNMSVGKIEAEVRQYGGYVTLTDMLLMTAIDNNLVQATKLISSQAGRTKDTLTRDTINGGTVVQYAQGGSSRASLTVAANVITVDDVKKAVRTLEKQDAPRIAGYYMGIIHPDVKYDLLKDPMWRNPHEYKDTTNIYENEIGEIYGVRFIQASRAKVFAGAGANSADVYSTLIIADNAYGTTEISGGGTELIIKQLGDGGTSDPLNQRATVGWKFTHVAEILVQQYLVRIESTASA